MACSRNPRFGRGSREETLGSQGLTAAMKLTKGGSKSLLPLAKTREKRVNENPSHSPPSEKGVGIKIP